MFESGTRWAEQMRAAYPDEWDRRGRLFFDRHLWDLLTDPDRGWLAGHMQLIYDMAEIAGPRNPYQSARR